MARSATINTSSGINIIAGIWLIIAPFVLNYASMGVTATNDVILGIIVAILAIIRVAAPSQAWASWLNLIAGIWLIISPFVLSNGAVGTVVANDVILGIIVGALAITSGASSTIENPV